MNEACITKCAPRRNTSWFELRQDLNLEDIPVFPQKEWQSSLNNLERTAILGVYLKLIVDDLKGVRNASHRVYPKSIVDRRKLDERRQLFLAQIAAEKSCTLEPQMAEE